MSRTTYWFENGAWHQQVNAGQCPEEFWVFDHRCQRVEGHDGSCWSYSPWGSFTEFWKNGGATSTPPGHAKWVHPTTREDEYYVKHYVRGPVTDPDILRKLEARELLQTDDVNVYWPEDEDDSE